MKWNVKEEEEYQMKPRGSRKSVDPEEIRKREEYEKNHSNERDRLEGEMRHSFHVMQNRSIDKTISMNDISMNLDSLDLGKL